MKNSRNELGEEIEKGLWWKMRLKNCGDDRMEEWSHRKQYTLQESGVPEYGKDGRLSKALYIKGHQFILIIYTLEYVYKCLERTKLIYGIHALT